MENPFWVYVIYGFILAQLATLITTVYIHRLSTHKAFKVHPAVEFLFQLINWLIMGITRKEWVAVHLCHHANADKDGDPHSPIVLGFWKVQLWNFFLYRKATKDPRVLWYGRNLNETFAEKTIFKSPVWGLVLGIAIALYTFGVKGGIIVSLTHATLYLFFLNNLVNGYCHMPGWGRYQLFPKVVAYNSRWVSLITMGEGLHNNHHMYASSAYLKYGKSEVDLGGLFIKVLCYLRLAKVG